MKVGEQIRVVNEIKDEAGALVDISTWTITGKVRRDNSQGVLLGDLTMSNPSIGVSIGVVETTGWLPGQVAIDVRFEPPGQTPLYTRTMYIDMEGSVT